MPFAPRAGHGTYWKTGGNGHRKALLIHCSLAHSAAWDPLVRRLSDSHSWCAFDMPGHGRSDPFDLDGTEDFQSLTLRIAESFCDEPMHVVGHSFGATVALRLATERPDLVQRLSLIEPVFFAAASEPVLEALKQEMRPFDERIAARDFEAAAALFNGLWGAQAWERQPEAQRRYMSERIHLIPLASPAIFDDCFGLLKGPLRKIQCPVDLIEGAQSHAAMPAILDGLAEQMSQAIRTTVAGAGHMVPITHPGPVARALI